MQEVNLGILVWKLSGGGAEKISTTIANHLSYNKLLITYTNEIDFAYNGKIISLNIPPQKNLFAKPLAYLKRIKKLRKIKAEHKINLTLSILDGANIVNILSKSNDKTILSVHNNLSRNEITKGLSGLVRKLLIKKFYNRADKIIAVSKGIKEDLIENFKIHPHKIRVIYNPHNIKDIEKLSSEPVEEQLEIIFRKFDVLINVGRLSLPKAQWELIKIFKLIKEKNKKVKLFILGDGELRNMLYNFSKTIGLRTYISSEGKDVSAEYDIYFTGWVKNPYKYLARSKLLVLTSLWEGFPNCIVEALTCSVPVVSSDCFDGPREILAPDTDFRVKVKNNAEFAKYGVLLPVLQDTLRVNLDTEPKQKETLWADTICRLLKDEETFNYYKNISPTRTNDFSAEKIIKEYEALIEELLTENR